MPVAVQEETVGTFPPITGMGGLITNPSVPSSKVPNLMGPSKPVLGLSFQKVTIPTLLSMAQGNFKCFLFISLLIL